MIMMMMTMKLMTIKVSYHLAKNLTVFTVICLLTRTDRQTNSDEWSSERPS